MNNDSAILQKIVQGDERSFTEAFDNYYVGLCYYADKIIHDSDESRSLVQQVFVDLWMKRHKLVIEQSLKAYLFTAVKNYSLDYLKHKLVEAKYLNQKQPLPVTYDQDLIEEAELNSRINSAIEELPEKCREIFILCRFEELRYSDIALRLGISIKTVEMQMGIALKKLRAKLTENQNIQILFYLFSNNHY
jgi:RNA polymerase sigma-70 factor, ECF subfamily